MALQETNFMIDRVTGDFATTADGTQIAQTLRTIDTIEQRIRTRLQTFRGEWYLDEGLGVPYFEEVMVKNPDVKRVRALLLTALLSVEGVKQVTQFEVAFIPGERRFTVNFHCISDDNEVVEGAI